MKNRFAFLLMILALLLVFSQGCSRNESVLVVVPHTGSGAGFDCFKGLPDSAPKAYKYSEKKEKGAPGTIVVDFYGFEKAELPYKNTVFTANGDKYRKYELDNDDMCFSYYVDGEGNVALCSVIYGRDTVSESDRISEEKAAELAEDYFKTVETDAEYYSRKETLTYTAGVPGFWVFAFEREADGVTVGRILITVRANGQVTGYENYSRRATAYYAANSSLDYKRAIDISDDEIRSRIEAGGEELSFKRQDTYLEASKNGKAYVVSKYSVVSKAETTINPYTGEEVTGIDEITVYVYVPDTVLR